MARTAALIASRMLGRGPALLPSLALEAGRFAYENWDQIMDLFGGAGATGHWGLTHPELNGFQHPPDATNVRICDAAEQIGPTARNQGCGDFFVSNAVLFTPATTASGTYTLYEMLVPGGSSSQVRTASVWTSPSESLGEFVTLPAIVQPIVDPLAQPAVRTAGAGRPPVHARYGLPTRGERAKGLAQRGFALVSGFYGSVDEVKEFVDAFHDAMEGPCKRKGAKGIAAKVGDILRCAGSVNLNRLARNLIVNEIEDRIIGRGIGAASRTTRWVRGGVGSAITGPAL